MTSMAVRLPLEKAHSDVQADPWNDGSHGTSEQELVLKQMLLETNQNVPDDIDHILCTPHHLITSSTFLSGL